MADYISRHTGAEIDEAVDKMLNGDFEIRIVNDLTTGGEGDPLSAEMGVVIRNNVDILQAKIDELIRMLANIAFTVEKTDVIGVLDWRWGPRYVTVQYDQLEGVTVTDNTNDGHIERGDDAVITLIADEYYTLTGATISVKDDRYNAVPYTLVGGVLTIAQIDRSVYIKVVAVLDGAHLVTIPTVEHLTFKDGDDNEVSGTLIVPDGDPLELTLVPDELWGIESCAVEMGGDEVIDAYSWEFDAKWNRVHTINIAAVTGDVGIAVVMEDWNVIYTYVNVLTAGRILWGFQPSYITPAFPVEAGNLIKVTFGSADEIHAVSFYNNAGKVTTLQNTYRNVRSPLSATDVKAFGAFARISYKAPDDFSLTKFEDLTTGETLWDGEASGITKSKGNAAFIERFLPSIIMDDGYNKTDVQEQTSNPDYSGNGVTWAYRYKVWAPSTSACSFIFNLPQVATLTIHCGSGGGVLYVYYTGASPWTRSSYNVGTSETTLTNISTIYKRGFLHCIGGAEDLHNSYVKYNGQYVWWGKNVHPQAGEIWSGAGVVSLPSLVEDVWIQSNE